MLPLTQSNFLKHFLMISISMIYLVTMVTIGIELEGEEGAFLFIHWIVISYVSDYILQLCCVNDLVEICIVSIKVNINNRKKNYRILQAAISQSSLILWILGDQYHFYAHPYRNSLFWGDANINLRSNNGIVNQYKNIMYNCSFLPHITLPTRDNANGCTLIDHV